MAPTALLPLLSAATAARQALFDPQHLGVFRLLNGFYEGCPQLAIDVYARSLLIHNYADSPEQVQELIEEVSDFAKAELPWIQAVIVKARKSPDPQARNGSLLWGGPADRRVREDGVWYALDLLLNQDASLYLDTRLLRNWAMETLSGKSVLNTFAYTGSLGVAARAGGARRVVQIDRNRRFLDLAKSSYQLNGFPQQGLEFHRGDFWKLINRFKGAAQLFDCVFIDPPFFSASPQGTVDLLTGSQRIINKIRPLVAQDGYLVSINNSLFLSGADYLHSLEELCQDGYLRLERLIPVPEDFTGYPQTQQAAPPVDPAPFNHPTKIAVLRVQRKDKAASHP